MGKNIVRKIIPYINDEDVSKGIVKQKRCFNLTEAFVNLEKKQTFIRKGIYNVLNICKGSCRKGRHLGEENNGDFLPRPVYVDKNFDLI